MQDGSPIKRHRRRRPSGGIPNGDQITELPVSPRVPPRWRSQRSKTTATNRPNKMSTSLQLQVVTGVCICVANGFLIGGLGWMWYSKGIKLPSILQLFEDDTSELSDQPKYHKVEKMWRYDRNQFQLWNTTATSTVPPPMIVVGLPKAGTSSIFEFLSCHGVYSQHWYCCGPQTSADVGPGGPRFGPSYMSHCLLENLQEQAWQTMENNAFSLHDAKWNHSILDGCGDYEAFTELNGPYIPPRTPSQHNYNDPFHSTKGIFLPQHYHLEELHAAAPTATWILNIRDVNDWVRSVGNVPARSLVERLQYEILVRHADENVLQDKYQDYSDLIKDILKQKTALGLRNTLRKGDKPQARNSIPRWKREEAFLRDFWYDHIQRVQDFASKHNHPLIIVNISDPNAGVQLGMDLWGPVSNVTDRVAKPNRFSHSRMKACWKHMNAGDYQR